jgi:CDP-glucose 4,6-dehydratase
MIDRAFWRERRVLLTGHTGFKGAWLSLWLERLGAKVIGLALPPDSEPALYSLLEPFSEHQSRMVDMRDPAAVAQAIDEARPQIVIHMAAQSLVRRSYRQPVETIATNVMGTVYLLESLRKIVPVQAVLVVTTDKVYSNAGRPRALAEDAPLGGADPYSASKAATELVVASLGPNYFAPRGVAVATARSGNVIGGGDWAEDRLVPDIWRAWKAHKPLRLRHPHATRPWQHVLEPLAGYLMYAEKLAAGADVPRALNFGPRRRDALTAAQIADAMIAGLPGSKPWVMEEGPHPEEAEHLALDSARAVESLDWHPRLSSRDTLQWTAAWYRAYAEGGEPRKLALDQIARYEALK